MKRICPKCLTVSDSTNSLLKGSLLSGGALIGLGFLSTAITFYDNDYVFLIIGVLAIIIGTISIVYYFKKFNKSCPKCKYENMPTINEPEGQKVLSEKGMNVKDDSTHHCSNCGYGVDGIVQNKIASIVLIVVGIISIPFITYHVIGIIGSLTLIGVGIYGVWTNYRKTFTCPNCKNNTLIANDSK